jgi:hypothetical protein
MGFSHNPFASGGVGGPPADADSSGTDSLNPRSRHLPPVSYSLNLPVPGEVKRLAADLHPALVAFETVRERHTLVCKRLTGGGREGDGVRSPAASRLRERLRTALDGTPAFEARIAGIDAFEAPARGTGPVVYLAVESPGLVELHRRLCGPFPPVEGIEGDGYVPHVTLARDGSLDDAERLRERSVEPVEWTVSELRLWDADRREPAARFSLPR